MFRRLSWIAGLPRLPFRVEMVSRVAAAQARAAATAAAREIDPARPLTWEFSGFSQHGEDGVIDYLCARLLLPNRYFVEIGSADGVRNCSAWLALSRRFGGLMVEADPRLSRQAARMLRYFGCHNVLALNRRVTPENIAAVLDGCPYRDPDVFIIDIDGIDYHILARVLSLGYAPAVVVVEYNSVFGPERAVTVPCDPDFSRATAHSSLLYYGASIGAWQHLLERHGYRFVTVDSNGVNAFFIRPGAFPAGFADGLDGLAFRDNQSDKNGATMVRTGPTGDPEVPLRSWRAQYPLIRDMPLVEVGEDEGD